MNAATALCSSRKSAAIRLVLLIIFAAAAFAGAMRHELWFDEAQAWCIARDCTIENFADILKHEGHPALWYLILMPFAKLGAPCVTLNIISWFFSVLAAGFFMYKAPFGLMMKSAVLFSSGFLFFNSVNSRVYCLIPLLLFLIAAVYPKREKYAPLYGLLVGLLANTHIMMCGLVGILGIFMLAELIKAIKANGLKEAWGRIIGLAIAGVLVVCMILPLVGSLSANNITNNKSVSVGAVGYGIISCFNEAAQNLMPFPHEGLSVIFGAIIGVALIVFIIGLFSCRKAFIMALSFVAVYGGIIEGLWFTTQLRASIFLYTLVAVFWIALENEQPLPFPFPKDNGKGLTHILCRLAKNPRRLCCIMLCIALAGSAPAGIYWLATDIAFDTSVTKDASRFIKEKLPQDAVIIVSDQSGVQFSAYCPDTEFYSLELQRFITYSPHETAADSGSSDSIRQALAGRDSLYLLSYSQAPAAEYEPSENTVYYAVTDHLPPYGFEGVVTISGFDLESSTQLQME